MSSSQVFLLTVRLKRARSGVELRRRKEIRQLDEKRETIYSYWSKFLLRKREKERVKNMKIKFRDNNFVNINAKNAKKVTQRSVNSQVYKKHVYILEIISALIIRIACIFFLNID